MNTASAWLECTDPQPMLEFLARGASGRAMDLFKCACCRLLWDLLTDPRSRHGVLVAERHADGLVSQEEWDRVKHETLAVSEGFDFSGPAGPHDPLDARHTAAVVAYAATTVDFFSPRGIAQWTANALAGHAKVQAKAPPNSEQERAVADAARKQAYLEMCDILRDIFGNPFHPLTLDPDWLTWNAGTAPRLARAISEDQAFDRLPILADALEEAGCTNLDLLIHCRQPGEHVLGCWLVDLVMGKG
jgi:hypothetical protein